MSKNWRDSKKKPSKGPAPGAAGERVEAPPAYSNDFDEEVPGTKDWRQSTKKKKPPAGRKEVWKFSAIAVLLLACLGFVVFLIIWLYKDRLTYFEIIQIGAPERLALPQIQYGNEDLKDVRVRIGEEGAFLRVLPGDDVATVRRAELGPDLTSRRLDQFRTKLTDRLKIPRKKDRLVIYVSAYGVNGSDGNPYLLCQDYSVSDDFNAPGSAKRYAVSDLIDAMAASKAKTKLLVLDVNHVVYDPRLGIVLNDFQRALESCLKSKTKDPSLWVLCSTSVGEKPLPLPGQEGTIFGKSFFDALLGRDPSADENGDRKISLEELFGHVWDKCNEQGQSPLLMRPEFGLSGDAEIPKHLLLANFPTQSESKQESKDEEPNDGESGSPSPDQVDPIVASTKASASEADESETAEEGSADPDGEANETKAKPAAKKESEESIRQRFLAANLDEKFNQVWQERDKLLRGSWSPKYYAPFVWRQLNAMLVDLEQRSRGGNTIQTETDTELTRTFTALITGQVFDTGQIDSGAVVEKLLKMRKKSETWQSPEESGNWENCQHLLKQVQFDLVDYTRWHGEAALIATKDADISTLYGDVHEAVKDLLDRIGKIETALARDPAAAAQSLDDLEAARAESDSIREQIVGRVMKSASNETMPVASFKHIELLLRTPLPESDKRQLLRQLLVKAIARELVDSRTVALATGNAKKRRQLELEAKLLGMDALIEKQTRAHYSSLPDENPLKRWLVDPRDAERMLSDAGGVVAPPPRMILTHAPQSEDMSVPVALNEETKIELSCDTADTSLKVWTATPSWSSDEIVVYSIMNGKTVQRKITESLRFGVKWKEGAGSTLATEPIDITFEVAAGKARRSHSIKIARDKVALAITPSLVQRRSNLSGYLQLTPFPGRDTTFGLQLTNVNKPSIRGPVKVQLYAMPKPQRVGLQRLKLARDLRLDEFKQRLDFVKADFLNGGDGGCRLLAPQPPALGPDGKPGAQTTFPLPKPGETTSIQFPNMESSDEDEAEASGMDVSDGLLVVVTDKANKKQFFPIEVEPLHPSDYLDLTFNVGNQSIEANFAPRDLDRDGVPDILPDNLTDDNPISIHWETWRAHEDRLEVGDSTEVGKLRRRFQLGERGTIREKIGMDKQPVTLSRIRLRNDANFVASFTVDGYPRAFVYEIPLRGNPLDLSRSSRVVRINTLAIEQPIPDADFAKKWGRHYHTWDEEFNRENWNLSRHRLDRISSDLQPFYYGADKKPVASFPSAATITAELQVDCPKDLFRALKVGFGRRQQHLTQRRRIINASFDGSGSLVLNTRISDHVMKMDLNFVGRETLEAELFTTKAVDREKQDSVVVVTDNEPKAPKYKLVVLGDPTKNNNLRPGDGWRVKLVPESGEQSNVGLAEARIQLVDYVKGKKPSRNRPESYESLREIGFDKTLYYPAPDIGSAKKKQFYFQCWYTDQLGRTENVWTKTVGVWVR